MKKYAIRLTIGAMLMCIALAHSLSIFDIPFLGLVDHYLYDVRVRMSAPRTVDSRVVIVDLDERSLAEVGRWPWSRDKVAEVVRRLIDQYRVAVVGFDVVFADPDTSSGLPVLDALSKGQLRDNLPFKNALNDLRGKLDYDHVFAQMLKGKPVVLGYYFSGSESPRKDGVLPQPIFLEGFFAGRKIDFDKRIGFGGNLAIFQQAAAGGGHFVPLPDRDGVSRRVPMLIEHEGNYYEALSMAMLRIWRGGAAVKPFLPPQKESAVEWFDLRYANDVIRIPVDRQVAALVPYRGPQSSFPYVSAVDVLTGRAESSLLEGKIVLVGTSAGGLKDLRVTPFGEAYPGVEIHANIISGALDNSFKTTPPYADAVEAIQIVLVGGTMVLLLPLLLPARAAMLTATSLLVVVGLNLILWEKASMVFPMAPLVILIIALWAFDAAWGYFFESRTKRQFTDLFGQYVPPELVEEMAKDPETYSMDGKKQELTVLFSDVRSFTTISEGLDPGELTQLMNAYLGKMTLVIRGHRGTLDKYIGDAIMAFWGAPVSNADHAREAVLAALEMQKALRELDVPFKERGWPELQIGVGINTGMMTVGDMGSAVRKAYTVMGDAVNLASRLEGITKQYGVGIIVGEATRAVVRDVLFREIDRVRVKGKDEPVGIFEPLGLSAEIAKETQDELKLWQQALRLYRAQDWDGAELQLYHLQQRSPNCGLYKKYTERIAIHRANPPGEGWDGVTTFETK